MKFALIPVSESELGDRFFYSLNPDGTKNWVEDQLHVYWDWFCDRGHEIHTIDMYGSYDEIDYIFLYWLDWAWIKKLTKAGQNNKIVYCNAEPPTVIAENCPEGYELLKKIFPYILTWNREWVDNEYIFYKPIHYVFEPDYEGLPFNERKLATAITAYKTSDYKFELYSERERAYTFFEKKYPDEFDFYGWGWKSDVHPCYRGTVKDKRKVYHGYKFAICLENTKGLSDYVTEKIYDCLCSGIVPVYGGAKNILEHVPAECFIDYFSFNSLDELASYLENMTEEEHGKYLEAAKKFIDGIDREPFRYYQIGASAYEAVSHKHTITVPADVRKLINKKGTKEELARLKLKLILKLKNH